MRALLICVVLSLCVSVAAQDRGTVSAQAHAEHLAATGTFGHCSRRGGGFEGIGMSSTSSDHAIRSCCYWGKRRVREIGVAWSAVRRIWIAVVRYD